MITIPVAFRAPHQRQTTTLGGRRYILALDWIQRIQRWTISISTEDGALLLAGKGLAVEADLLKQVRYNPAVPRGLLTLLDLERTSSTEASLESLGRRHALVYLEEP